VGVVIGLLVWGGSNGEVDQAADTEKVMEVMDEYAAAVNAGDLERWMALWSEDGRRIPPPAFQPPQHGKDEIRAAMQPVFEASDQTATIDAQDVQILGQRAYSLCTFEITVTPKEGGETFVLEGNALSILEKQDDGSWKLLIDCYNF
jgi:uncharacterized protein (TIGR02246 family)